VMDYVFITREIILSVARFIRGARIPSSVGGIVSVCNLIALSGL